MIPTDFEQIDDIMDHLDDPTTGAIDARIETLKGLFAGIAENADDLWEALQDPTVETRQAMEQHGYTLAADLLTAGRGIAVPYITYIFSKEPEDRTWLDASVVGGAWTSDLVDGRLSRKAKEPSEYGGPADKDIDKLLWHVPSAMQVVKGEMSPIAFMTILVRDIQLEKVRDAAEQSGDGLAHTAKMPGKVKAGVQATSQTFSASPLGARHPEVKVALQWASVLVSTGSGVLTAAELESGRLGLEYAAQRLPVKLKLGMSALRHA